MDIEYVLTELILKYDIDRKHPEFRKVIAKNIDFDRVEQDVINDGRFQIVNAIKERAWDLSHVIYQERENIRRATDVQQKISSLQKLIFDYIYIRDFVNAQKVIKRYVENEYQDYKRYEQFSIELTDFFSQIKESVKDKHDILHFWTDAIDYGWEKNMPFLNEISDRTVYFENAYTCTNWTSYTMKNILCGLETIDGKVYQVKKIGHENSKLSQTLAEKKVGLCYYGYHTYSLRTELCCRRTFSRYQPSTLLIWEALRNMMLTNRRYLHIIHIFAETHPSWLFGNIEGPYFEQEIYNPKLIRDREDALKKRRQAREYVDDQLRFYCALLGEECTKIFMSDHGDGWDQNYDYFSDACHTMLMILDQQQSPRRLKNFFNYVDYSELIKPLLDGEQLDESICKEYTRIQGLNYCATYEIKKSMNKENFKPDFLMGYRGVITKDENYVLRSDGYERYRRAGDRINYIDFSKYQERLNKLRELAGSEFPDIYSEEEFISSRAVATVTNRYNKRVGVEELGCKILKKYVDDLPKDAKIVIRGGGEHTNSMLSVLADRYKRIAYIADKNMVSKSILGIPFILPEQLPLIHPDVVIISSLNYRVAMKEELEEMNLNCSIFDVYEELEKKGIYLNKGFYERNYVDSDFRWIRVRGRK